MNEIKAIVTVIGKDTVGIIAGVANTLARNNINVMDINQTVMQGYFTMVMVVDLAACEASFGDIAATLKSFGESRGLDIRIQRGDIFDAMYQI